MSDGNRALDRVACDMLIRRARFTPARDPAGLPVAAVVRQDFTVNAPEGARRAGEPAETARRVDFALPVARLPQPGAVLVADLLLMTDAAGHVTACDVAATTGLAGLDRAACREMLTTSFAPARDHGGQAMPALRAVSVGFSAGDVPR